MAPFGDRRVTVLLGAFLLSLFLLVALGAFGLLAVVTALATATGTTPLVFVALDAALPYALGAAFVGMLSFLLLVASAFTAVRQASLPTDERLARIARNVERVSEDAREFGLAERFEPSTEERIEELKAQYVAGKITELEYERRLQELLGEERTSEDRVWPEQREFDREFEREFER